MGWFKSALKGAAKGGVQAANASLKGNVDYLQACCAAAALVGASDGMTPAEKQTAIEVVAKNPTLGEMFDRAQIEQCMVTMIGRADNASGRFALLQELKDISKQPDGPQLAVYVSLMARDIASADGAIGDKEKKAIAMVDKTLGVDPAQFDDLA